MAKLQGWSSGTTPARDAEAGFLDYRDELLYGHGLRIVEHPGFALIERRGGFLHARASLKQRLDGLGTAAAVHALDPERHGIHIDLLFPIARASWPRVWTLEPSPRSNLFFRLWLWKPARGAACFRA